VSSTCAFANTARIGGRHCQGQARRKRAPPAGSMYIAIAMWLDL
jgi:hypothetical protein